MTLQRLKLLSAVVLVGMLVVACGTAAPSGDDPQPVAQEEDLLDKVKRTGELVIALSSIPPLEFQDPETKEWKGTDVDILKDFAAHLGAELKVESMQWAAVVQSVRSRRADISANMYKTPERAQEVDFSDPATCYVEGVIVNAEKPKIAELSVEGLNGKRIATIRGSGEEKFFENLPKAENVSYDSLDQTFLEVSSGRVDATFQPIMYAEWALQSNPDWKIKVLGPTPPEVATDLAQAAGHYGVAKGEYSKRFLEELNTFLVEQRRSGRAAEIFASYGLHDDTYYTGCGMQQ